MTSLNLSDLPPEAVEKLKPLMPRDFEMLAIDASNLRDMEERRSYPLEPAEALKGAWEAFKRQVPAPEVDSVDMEVRYSLRLAVLILGRDEDLDGQDGAMLAWLLDRADTLMRRQQEVDNELRARLYRPVDAMRGKAA